MASVCLEEERKEKYWKSIVREGKVVSRITCDHVIGSSDGQVGVFVE